MYRISLEQIGKRLKETVCIESTLHMQGVFLFLKAIDVPMMARFRSFSNMD